MKEAHGANVFPEDGKSVFYFDVTVDENGLITSQLPAPAEVGGAKSY